MNNINVLIFLAIMAWLLQILLGWWQISNFNRAFRHLSTQGKIGIGRYSCRFKPKVIIAIVFDQNNRVINSLLMQGYTVFSRPKKIPQLQGLNYDEINPCQIFPKNLACQQALREALKVT
ncbi:transcriptional regulator GutM [Mergibacter septicus]|uniref:Transcriptional regulator GutM n=1 Tax=Mergibacter septicus TaxID=221402 RepID=A0A8E3MF36_9PAST|nr:transcriptional regulator GutM [Mergibacter septicus]AWX14980.1 transcriptional regulator GutM [Mergibacter septicus]QDJ14232.1 transcriptional regulator GutM [Mergibacter septicus]UTU48323.1 transcriptional regulator GutM [Mergibacter septicus]WMR96052.1 transcriptional regulator GutM [Mergibacter septicus]